MVNNTEIIKEVVDSLKVDVLVEKVPEVVPTLEVHPRLVTCSQVVKYAVAVNNADTTIYQTPLNQDFYLTSASICMLRDATATSIIHRLRITVDDGSSTGNLVELLAIPWITLTAGTQSMSISLPRPIKIKRGGYLSLMSTNTTGNYSFAGTITGFLLSN